VSSEDNFPRETREKISQSFQMLQLHDFGWDGKDKRVEFENSEECSSIKHQQLLIKSLLMKENNENHKTHKALRFGK